MPRSARAFLLAFPAAAVLLAGCAPHRNAASGGPSLHFEQGSLRMTAEVEADGTVSLARSTPMLGRIEIAPIVEAEGRSVSSVQILAHRGRYYITAEEFVNVWEVIPSPGEPSATYRPIRVNGDALAGVRLSRYGSADHVCIRVDLEDSGPYFLGRRGKLDDDCS